MKPNELDGYVTATQPAAHPEERRVAFVVTRADIEADRNERRIWMWDGDTVLPHTAGPGDSKPQWSPNGKWLAFLRIVDKAPQLAVMRSDGGEASVLTDFSHGVWEFDWSPDSAQIACTARQWREELDPDERARRPRRITEIPYRFDFEGWRADWHSAIWIADPTGEHEVRRLTGSDRRETSPSWHPEDGSVAFLSDHTEGQVRMGRSSICRATLDDPFVEVVTVPGQWTGVTHRPDGVLHAVGDPAPDAWPSLISLWQLGDEARDLTGHLDRSIFGLASPALPQWDGDSAVCSFEDGGRAGVIAVRPDGAIDRLLDGDRVITGFAPGVDGVAFTASTYTEPGDVFWRSADGTELRITDLNADSDLGWVAGEHFQVPSEGTEIDAWVYLPPGHGPVPVLLNIHGGPASQYGFGFFDEFQAYVGAGFGVIACNPRGSAGRGREFLRAVTGEGWGAVDLVDIRAVVDAALDRFDRLDGSRLGVMGGSYGGFLTAWVTAHDDRYRSAVVERALLSWESFAGTSDIGSFFPNDYLGANMPDGAERLRSASPLAIADRITCPTLIVHAEEDWRCPIEQAEQLFAVLLRSGTHAEMLRFPGEGHELSRAGKPRHRVERFDAIIDWHSRHLDLAN